MMSTTHYGYPDAEEADFSLSSRPDVILPEGQSLKGRIEAVLFLTSKALSIADIAQLLEVPYDAVEMALIELMGDFAQRHESSLEIDDTDGYILQVKEDYADVVNVMMPLEMSAAELRTLSAIAIKAPVLQSDLIEWRGSVAYEHIAQLLQNKLITKRREGRSYLLNVTRHFHEYFKLTADKKDLAHLVHFSGKEPSKKEKSALEHSEVDETVDPSFDDTVE